MSEPANIPVEKKIYLGNAQERYRGSEMILQGSMCVDDIRSLEQKHIITSLSGKRWFKFIANPYREGANEHGNTHSIAIDNYYNNHPNKQIDEYVATFGFATEKLRTNGAPFIVGYMCIDEIESLDEICIKQAKNGKKYFKFFIVPYESGVNKHNNTHNVTIDVYRKKTDRVETDQEPSTDNK
jgi:hypothetical protein